MPEGGPGQGIVHLLILLWLAIRTFLPVILLVALSFGIFVGLMYLLSRKRGDDQRKDI